MRVRRERDAQERARLRDGTDDSIDRVHECLRAAHAEWLRLLRLLRRAGHEHRGVARFDRRRRRAFVRPFAPRRPDPLQAVYFGPRLFEPLRHVRALLRQAHVARELREFDRVLAAELPRRRHAVRHELLTRLSDRRRLRHWMLRGGAGLSAVATPGFDDSEKKRRRS